MKNHAADKIGASALAAALIMALSPMSALATTTSAAASGGTPPSMPGASSGQVPGGNGGPGGPGGPGGSGGQQPGSQQPGGSGGGADTQTFDYTGTYTGVVSADGSSESTKSVSSSGKELSSTTADENVALAQNGGTLDISGDTLTKSGDETDGDKANFYGVNSSVLSVGSGSLVKLANSSVSSTSEGSNGLFATDSGTIYANNDTITTKTGGNSRGLDATYGGTIVGNALTVSTEGDHCAATATDRGGGYISVSNSQLATAGSGSPLVYSTGDIELDNVTGTATGSQIAGMEGVNKILVKNSELSSTNDHTSGSDPIKNAVILYQSTSGDAETSASDVADFEASGSKLSTSISDGAFFYVTNTAANIVLQDDTLSFDSGAVELLHAAGNNANNWGSSGSNAGNATLTGIGQTLAGNVYADSISKAVVYLTDGSTWTGAVAGSNTTSDGTTAAPGNVTVNVDGTSTWTVTGDTTVGNLNVASGGKVVDSNGNAATIVDGNGNVLSQGTGSVTVTVTGSYTADATISGAGTLSGASDTLVSARAAFDSAYGTSTAWGGNSGTSGSSASGSGSASDDSGSSSSGSGGTGTSSTAEQATSIEITARTVSAKSLKAVVEEEKTSASKITTVTLGKNVKTVKKAAFKGYKNLKTIVVKTAKLTKKSVKGSLKGSKVKIVKVKVASSKTTNAKYVKKYKSYFAKANSGKSVTVKSA